MDIYLVPLGGDESDDGPHYDPADLRENPEESLLRHESQREAAGSVDKFLTNLRANVRGKIKQYNRMLGVLWHCYLSPEHATQLEVAATLGVSDSLVSDYRRRIEQELRALSFAEVEEARMFELALRERVRMIVTIVEEDAIVG
jgi:DNA-directed RNA polymerase specialized sigma subunit